MSAIDHGTNLLVLGEAGSGLADLPLDVAAAADGDVAIATYKGSGKKFFQAIAEQLGCPTEDPETEKPLTMDGLKEEILLNVSDRTVFVLPEAKRLTTGIRYWLEDCSASGATLICFASSVPQRDIFLDMVTLELSAPEDDLIREVMAREADRIGLTIDRSRLAALQPLAGRNPMLARKVIRAEKLGLNREAKPEHTQYLVIMPIILALLMSFAVLRFVGLGTKNQSLYIFGGISLVAAMALKQIGQIRGARKGLGA
ncbi:hypothetical protein [Baaleninema sp.]|uniref:hypothetical protein n=1 Tax=Baaleninema sp. TaxID=3101197 RepID=UPI003CFD01DC